MYEINDLLQKQRDALSGLHIRLYVNLTGPEYNALVKAIWRIDRQLKELNEMEQQNV